MLERYQKELFLCAVLLCGGWILFGGRRTHLKPFDPSSSAAKYGDEFYGYMWTTEVSEMTAPDGSATILDEMNMFPIMGACHTLWASPKSGRRKMIAKILEVDSGSGTTWGLGWSRDSKAIFLRGNHQGLDCRSGFNSGQIDLIFTLVDGVAMQPPPGGSISEKVFRADIPSADTRKIKEIREPERWLNPWIRIRDRTVDVSYRPSGTESIAHTVQIDALRNELFSIPKTAWPYGKIVAVSMSGPQSAATSSEYMTKVNKPRVEQVLKTVGVSINWWP